MSSFYVWHTGDKERIHSRPAEKVNCSNVAINLLKKRFLLWILDLSKGEAKLLSGWLVCFDGIKSRKLNYRADACGFNNTEDLNKVKQHIWYKGETWRSVIHTLALDSNFASSKASLHKIVAANIIRNKK